MNATMESLMEIHEIGDIMAESIHEYFNLESNITMIQACMQSGITVKKIEKIQSSKFSGKIFVFTGSLEKFTRKDAQDMVENLGARSSNSVSRKTNFLIAGPGSGSKLNKAIELGITVLSADEFLNKINKANG